MKDPDHTLQSPTADRGGGIYPSTMASIALASPRANAITSRPISSHLTHHHHPLPTLAPFAFHPCMTVGTQTNRRAGGVRRIV